MILVEHPNVQMNLSKIKLMFIQCKKSIVLVMHKYENGILADFGP